MGVCSSLASAGGCDFPALESGGGGGCLPRTLAALSPPFFGKPRASARIFTDVKIDDALFLWTFFLLNLRRPVQPPSPPLPLQLAALSCIPAAPADPSVRSAAQRALSDTGLLSLRTLGV